MRSWLFRVAWVVVTIGLIEFLLTSQLPRVWLVSLLILVSLVSGLVAAVFALRVSEGGEWK